MSRAFPMLAAMAALAAASGPYIPPPRFPTAQAGPPWKRSNKSQKKRRQARRRSKR